MTKYITSMLIALLVGILAIGSAFPLKPVVRKQLQANLAHTQSLKSMATGALTLLTGPILANAADDGTNLIALSYGKPILEVFINLMSFLFICRTVMSWYPKTDLNKFPYNVAAWPTEPLLSPVRELIPPAFGVDVSSIAWVAILSFFREILTGQQGILTLLEKAQ